MTVEDLKDLFAAREVELLFENRYEPESLARHDVRKTPYYLRNYREFEKAAGEYGDYLHSRESWLGRLAVRPIDDQIGDGLFADEAILPGDLIGEYTGVVRRGRPGKPLPGRKNVVMTRNAGRASSWENLVYTDMSPKTIVDDLEKAGFSQAILAGGATINTLFAQAGLIDEIMITICPTIFGAGISLFSDSVDMDLALKNVETVGEGLVLVTYSVKQETHPIPEL